MSLNEMELPASTLSDLYKNLLVEGAAEKTNQVSQQINNNNTTKKNIQFLGKNQKGICLLVNYPNDVYLPDEQLNFLTSILQACRLNLGDVAIINHYKENLSFTELRNQITCNYLIIFGIDPSLLKLDALTSFTIQNINNCYVVYAEPAEQLNTQSPESKLMKSKLWNCLKQLFNV